MTNLDISKGSDLEELKEQWDNLSEEALKKEMWRYYMEWKFDLWEKLHNYIQERKNPSKEAQKSIVFETKYKALNDDIEKIKKKHGGESDKKAEQEEINTRMKEFFKDDMERYFNETKDSVKKVEDIKNAEIDRLKSKLSDIVTEWPKLKEYFSLKRMRLVGINKAIENLKKDAENYPKNVLIYIMGLTDKVITWLWQEGKRTWIRLTWRRKSDDIKKHMDIIENKLKPKDWDSLRVKWLKDQLIQHLLEAKQAYVEKQKKSVGL